MSKSDLLGASDIKHNLNDEKSTIPKALQSRMIEDIVRKHVIAHTVPALWPADLIAEAGITNVNVNFLQPSGVRDFCTVTALRVPFDLDECPTGWFRAVLRCC